MEQFRYPAMCTCSYLTENGSVFVHKTYMYTVSKKKRDQNVLYFVIISSTKVGRF